MEWKLKQYENITKEIAELKLEIAEKRAKVTDIVSGSSRQFPYIKRGIPISGSMDTDETRQLQQKLSQKILSLQKEKLEIENFLTQITDSEIRRIIRLRYMERKTWQQVANRLNRACTADYARKKLKRFLEKC